jgi:hypothetical protein
MIIENGTRFRPIHSRELQLEPRHDNDTCVMAEFYFLTVMALHLADKTLPLPLDFGFINSAYPDRYVLFHKRMTYRINEIKEATMGAGTALVLCKNDGAMDDLSGMLLIRGGVGRRIYQTTRYLGHGFPELKANIDDKIGKLYTYDRGVEAAGLESKLQRLHEVMAAYRFDDYDAFFLLALESLRNRYMELKLI